MSTRIDRHGLQVDEVLDRFLTEEALPGTELDIDAFWAGVAEITDRFTSSQS